MKSIERRRSPPRLHGPSCWVGKATVSQMNLTAQLSQIVAVHRL